MAIIFIIIILPISLVLGIYTQYQIQTINTQTLYDNKLTSATYDAIRAFQINTAKESYSDLKNSKIGDIENSVSAFRNSIMTAFSLSGYSEDDLNMYIPALVYTLYDGFYIYSPYTNTNYKDDDGENLYGLKPYISYSCRYVKGDIDVVITYALDNHITVQGMINGEYINKDGYLIDGISKNQDGTGEIDSVKDSIYYNGVEIKTEQLKEYIGNQEYPYAKIYGTKYYLVGDKIKYISNGQIKEQCKIGDNNFKDYKTIIENNDSAKQYYYEAYKFTKWFKEESGLTDLTYEDAYDSVVGENGDVKSNEKVWEGNNTKIFQFNTASGHSGNIENELSNFNQHRLAVIRHKIELNLSIAISNYNTYSGAATSNVFQMPELKEDEWDYITHNISLISFLQGLPIGGKIYNGYSIVTNSESEEVVLEQYIYVLGTDTTTGRKEYYRIGDAGIEDNSVILNSSEAGRLNLDFTRKSITGDNDYYYYPLKDYNASYNSIVMQNNMTTYDDIYEYVNNSGNDNLKVAFYTALGRERWGILKASDDAIHKEKILLVGADTNSGVYKSQTVKLAKALKQNGQFDVDYQHYSIEATATTEAKEEKRAEIGAELDRQKENYDLIIMNNYVWNTLLPTNISEIAQYTNVITISNDANAATIPMITSVTPVGNTHGAEIQINRISEKINIDLDSSGYRDSSSKMIKFDTGTKVLYELIYNGNTYDAIGYKENTTGKRWIHSQLSLGSEPEDLELIDKLSQYAIYGY